MLICLPLFFLAVGSMESAGALSHMLGSVVGGEGYAFPGFSPADFSLSSYVEILLDTPHFHVLVGNSVLYTVLVLIGQFLVATPAAWALACYDFRWKGALFFLYVVLMMLPFQVLMLPNYLTFQAFGINDTIWAIVLPGVFSAFPVFIMRQFFSAIPRSLIDAARLDGSSELRIFFCVGVPLGAPGIFAAMILGFFEYWSLVEQPLAFLSNQALWPISMFMPTLTFDNVGAVFAAAVISAIPGMLVFWWGKGYLERGIASTTKGDR